MATKYLYVNTAPTKTKAGTVEELPDKASNPVFNFDQSFIDGLEGITALELNQSQAYIDLAAIDMGGEVIENFSVNFLNRNIDFEQLGSGLRYSDRPEMSLVNAQIQSSNYTGYLYISEVTLNIKLHKPDSLTTTTLISLLFPEQNFRLTYGWNSPNDFLNDSKQTLHFSIKNYNINIDTDGQINLTIMGTAEFDRFNNTYIGDEGAEVNTPFVNNQEFDGLNALLRKRKAYDEHLKAVKDQESSQNDVDLLKTMAFTFKDAEKLVRGSIRKKFAERWARLRELTQEIEFGKKKVKVVTLHDVVFTMCNETLDALDTASPGAPEGNEFRVIYGEFNDQAGSFKGQSIADFPIVLSELKGCFKRAFPGVHTVGKLFNCLIDEFIENEEYWKRLLSGNELETFDKVDVYIRIENRIKTNKSSGKDEKISEIMFLDIHKDIPQTTANLGDGKKSQQEIEDSVTGGLEFPILRLGHAQSYIKNINLSHIVDQAMKSVLIYRQNQNRIQAARSTLVAGSELSGAPTKPLRLPFKGTLSVVGHTGWRPFRAFYLSTGIFIIDGVYKILNVKHNLSNAGFVTEIEFLAH